VDGADGPENCSQRQAKGHLDTGGLIDSVQFVYDGSADPKHGKVVTQLCRIFQGEMKSERCDPDEEESQVGEGCGGKQALPRQELMNGPVD
jgi:hypothetical protein